MRLPCRLLLLLTALACIDTGAQASAPETTPAAAAPAATPPPLSAARRAALRAARRPTRQIVGGQFPPVTDSRAPLAYPPVTASGMPDPVGMLPVHPSVPGAPAPVAPLPLPATSCQGANCIGADGALYRGGVGDVKLDPSGRTCRLVANVLQCF